MEEIDKKFKIAVILKMIGAVVVFFVVMFFRVWSKDCVERSLVQTGGFDSRWYFVYLISALLLKAMDRALMVLGILLVLFMIFSCITSGGRKEVACLADGVMRFMTFLLSGTGILILGVIMVVTSLCLPLEEIQEYEIEGEKISVLQAMDYQRKDIATEPERAIIRNYKLLSYEYTHFGKNGTYRNTVRYIRYEREGRELVVPCTTYMYGRMQKAELTEGESLEVFLLPHTGMIVDFAEVPLILKEEEEQLRVIVKEYGYPYRIELGDNWDVRVYRSAKYPGEVFDTYGKALVYEVYWIAGPKENGEERSITRSENPYDEMYEDGVYTVQAGKEDGIRLSEKVEFEIRGGDIVRINDNYIHINRN